MHGDTCIDYPVTNGEDLSSPAANNGVATATVGSKGADKESESVGHPVGTGDGTGKESEGRPVSSGMDLAPMDRLIEKVNENLRDCPCCKGSKLVLELDSRVGFASNYKLTCASCKNKEDSLQNTVKYLKRKVELCKDFEARRSVKRALYKKQDCLRKQKKTRTDRRITSPHLQLTSGQKKRNLWIILRIFVLW